MVEDLAHQGLRLLRASRVSHFQAVKTWKASTDPYDEAKKNRVLPLYAIADGQAEARPGGPTMVICMDEFGPPNRQFLPGPAVGAVLRLT